MLRDGTFQLDNGVCRNTISVQYFFGPTPAKKANCKPNEVEVPNVVGSATTSRRRRLEAQPLTPVVVYKPASAGQALHVVVKQIPARGRLSSYNRVTIVFAKPLHGVVPKVVGLKLREARKQLERLKLKIPCAATGSKIVRQRPKAGVAAGQGLKVKLWVKRG